MAKTKKWRASIHNIIYEADTFWGKAFDVTLLVLIIASIIVVMLDSIAWVHFIHGDMLYLLEWIFTILFTIEYILRWISLEKPTKYATSFFGIIDLLAILPTYISLLIPGTQFLLVMRAMRLLRIFRIFRLRHYLREMRFLGFALKNSARKISIFILAVLMLVVIFGSIIYLVEDASNGFTSIPQSIYWAIVTITTVGYGDVVPVTHVGKLIAGFIMILGYGIIAVPTGIVTTEMALSLKNREQRHDVCRRCGFEGHDRDAHFCKICGTSLEDEQQDDKEMD